MNDLQRAEAAVAEFIQVRARLLEELPREVLRLIPEVYERRKAESEKVRSEKVKQTFKVETRESNGQQSNPPQR